MKPRVRLEVIRNEMRFDFATGSLLIYATYDGKRRVLIGRTANKDTHEAA